MTTPASTSAAPRPSDATPRERVAALTSAAVGVVALVGVLVVGFAGSDSAASSSGPPGAVPGGAVATAGGNGVSATGRPSAVGPTPAAGLTRTTFLARFPLPPGAARSTLATDQHPVTGERFFLVRGALPDVRTFYAQRLPELGVSWSDLTPGTTRIDNGPEQIVSWWGRLSARTSPPIVGALRLDANYPGAPTGTVRIDLEVYP